MAKVYALAEQFKVPEPDYKNYNHKKEEAREEKFLSEVKDWAKNRNPTDVLAGVEYSIPHADGCAIYVVLSSKPVQLMHIPIGDAWDSPWADRITKKDIVGDIAREAQIAKLFAQKT